MLIFKKIRETSCFGLLRTNLTGNELSKENIFYKHFKAVEGISGSVHLNRVKMLW